MEPIQLLTEFGVPVGAAVLCGWFIYVMYTNQRLDNKEDKAKLYEVIAQTSAANDRVLESNKEILETNRSLMAEIKNDISIIKGAVVK